MLRRVISRTEKQASADTNMDVENSAWSLAQDERKYNRPINANELNSNTGREHLFTACDGKTHSSWNSKSCACYSLLLRLGQIFWKAFHDVPTYLLATIRTLALHFLHYFFIIFGKYSVRNALYMEDVLVCIPYAFSTRARRRSDLTSHRRAEARQVALPISTASYLKCLPKRFRR